MSNNKNRFSLPYHHISEHTYRVRRNLLLNSVILFICSWYTVSLDSIWGLKIESFERLDLLVLLLIANTYHLIHFFIVMSNNRLLEILSGYRESIQRSKDGPKTTDETIQLSTAFNRFQNEKSTNIIKQVFMSMEFLLPILFAIISAGYGLYEIYQIKQTQCEGFLINQTPLKYISACVPLLDS